MNKYQSMESEEESDSSACNDDESVAGFSLTDDQDSSDATFDERMGIASVEDLARLTVRRCSNIYVGARIIGPAGKTPNAVSTVSLPEIQSLPFQQNLQVTLDLSIFLTNLRYKLMGKYKSNVIPSDSREDFLLKCIYIRNDKGKRMGDVEVVERIFNRPSKNYRPPNRILIEGTSGSGKSTLLKQLAYDWAILEKGYLEQFLFVILLCPDERQDKCLLGAINRTCGFKSRVKEIEVVLQKEQKHLLLLVDGFEEWSESIQKELVNLMSFDILPCCTVVMTSFPGQNPCMNCFDKIYELRGLTPSGALHYLHRLDREDNTNKYSARNRFLSAKVKKPNPFHIALLSDENPLRQFTVHPLTLRIMWKWSNSVATNHPSKLISICTAITREVVFAHNIGNFLEKNFGSWCPPKFLATLENLGMILLKKLTAAESTLLTCDCILTEDEILQCCSKAKYRKPVIFFLSVLPFDNFRPHEYYPTYPTIADFWICLYINKCSKVNQSEFFRVLYDLLTASRSSTNSLTPLPLNRLRLLCGLFGSRAWQLFETLPLQCVAGEKTEDHIWRICFLLKESYLSPANLFTLTQRQMSRRLQLLTLLPNEKDVQEALQALISLFWHSSCAVEEFVIRLDVLLHLLLTQDKVTQTLLQVFKYVRSICKVQVIGPTCSDVTKADQIFDAMKALMSPPNLRYFACPAVVFGDLEVNEKFLDDLFEEMSYRPRQLLGLQLLENESDSMKAIAFTDDNQIYTLQGRRNQRQLTKEESLKKLTLQMNESHC